MPDITRSDSTRSDASRPRVSFNRDVHVKRIASPGTASAYSLSADGTALVPTAVRRQRPRTRREVQREARDVLRAAGAVGCRVSRSTGVSSSEPDSTSSNDNPKPNNFMSLDRKKLKRKDKKSNLDYLSLEKQNAKQETENKMPKPKLSMDAAKRKPLSPIIESPAVDYFHVKKENNIDKMKRALTQQTPKRPPRGLAVTGVVKSPGEIVHNQNRPFSYTEPIAEQGREPRASSPTSDVIYAQVVVSGSEEPRKTTVHTRVARAPDGSMTTALYGPNPGRQPTPGPDLARVRVAGKYDRYEKPTDLHDLSLRRQILLSRSESQARERFNSLKKVQEPRASRRRDTGLNNVRYLGNDTVVNDKFATSLRKIPKDVELVTPVSTNSTRRGKREVRSQEKTSDNLLQKLSRLGKSKSFIEDGAPNRGSKLDRVKGLFRKRSTDSEDDPLSTRYSEYRGSDLDSDRHLHSDPDFSEPDVSTRKRLSTPNSSRASQDSMGTLTRINNSRNKPSNHTNWFKSLDRLTKKGKQRNKNDGNQSDATSKSSNLRFFGDTDQESTTEKGSVGDLRGLNGLKQRYGLMRSRNRVNDSDSDRPESRLTDSTLKGSSKSKYDLDRPDYGLKQMKFRLNNSNSNNHNLSSNLSDTSTVKNCNYDYDINGLKYGPNISRSMSSVTNSSRPSPKERLRSQNSTPLITVTGPEEPLSRRVRSHGNLYRDRDGRRKLYDSSADSATEYDSVNSAKSTIYLHAATVGDIPGPRNLYRSDGRSVSRDELSSTGRSSPLGGSKKTLSRSISVLAPWRPKFRQEASLNYDSGNGSEFGRGKPPVGPVKKRSLSRERKPGEITFNTIGRENRRQKDLQR